MKAFSLLCTLTSCEYDHWIGYGHAAFFSNSFDTAVLAYYNASILRPDIPWPLIWAANAYEKMGNKEATIGLLDTALTMLEGNTQPDVVQLLQEIHGRLAQLKQ